MITADGKLTALDAKIVLDDNALFRHKDLAALRDLDEEDPYERQAREAELNYVKLDGNIGCLVNGAGLAMATMDMIKIYGGQPANFLDVGGGARAEKVAAALRIILSDKNVKAILFNIFGGITRCDEVARGIEMAVNQVGGAKSMPPMVIRLVGTNEVRGLLAAWAPAASTPPPACRRPPVRWWLPPAGASSRLIARDAEDRRVMTDKRLQTILAATKKGLQKLYGPRLKGLVLYGSYARGEATADSDIDVAVILDDYQDMWSRRSSATATWPVACALRFNVLVALYPYASATGDRSTAPSWSTSTGRGIAV